MSDSLLVNHIVLSLSSGTTDIPLLLKSQPLPSTSADNHGSGNYAKPPVAVALGGGFNDEMFEKVKAACASAPETIWLRADMSQVKGPPGPGEEEKYGKDTADRLRKKMGELKIGEPGAIQQGVFWF